MKKLARILILALVFHYGNQLLAQEEEIPEPSINLRYFNVNGKLQYLKGKALVREDNKLQPVSSLNVSVYLDEQRSENLLGNFVTDVKGEFKAVIPPKLQQQWKATTEHTFIAVSEPTKRFSAATAEIELAVAKIIIDTLNEEGERKVTALLLANTDGIWTPVTDAEMKLAVKRLGSDLNISEESYTTDSAGMVMGTFSLENLPAIDAQNNIVIVAKTEDHEQFGNVSFEKSVPWGVFKTSGTSADKRSLWADRNKAPVWLLLLANFILFSVWAVLLYLVVLIMKIKKAGQETSPPVKTAVPRKIPETGIHHY